MVGLSLSTDFIPCYHRRVGVGAVPIRAVIDRFAVGKTIREFELGEMPAYAGCPSNHAHAAKGTE